MKLTSFRWYSSSNNNVVCFQSLFVSFVAAFNARAQVSLDPQLARLPVVERIMQAPVFENPLFYVGDEAPNPVESQDLWAAIDVLRQFGPNAGIPALELFVDTPAAL